MRMKTPFQPDEFLKINRKNYLDRDSGIVTETDSEVEYSKQPQQQNYIFSDDDDQPNNTTPHYPQTNIAPILNSVDIQSYYSSLADQSVSSLRQCLKDDNWKKVLKHKSGITVHMLQHANKNEKNAFFRGESIIQGFTPQSIFYVIGMRKLWDDQFEDGKLIENLNDTTSLTYESYKSTTTSKAFDLTLVEKIECSASGEILFACTSIDTLHVPKTPGKNRHQIKLQGWVLKQVSNFPVSTKVTYVTQENIKGWIPGLTKKSLARKPLIIASIDSYLQKKAERIRLQQQQTNKNIPAHNAYTTINRSSHDRSSPTTTNSTITTSPLTSILQRPSSSSVSAASTDDQISPTLGPYSNTSSLSFISDVDSKASKPNNIILSNPPPRVSSLSTKAAATSSQQRRITFADETQPPARSSSLGADSVPSSARTSANSFQQRQPNHEDEGLTVTTQFPLPPSGHQLSPIQEAPSPFPSSNSQSFALPTKIPSTSKLYPASRHKDARKTCIDKLQAYAKSDIREWKHIGSKNQTQLYTQTVSDSTLPMMRSETMIAGNWTPEQVCSVIQCFGARKEWDEHFEDGYVVERFSQKEYLIYTQTKNLFPIQSRDFSLLTYIESNVATGAVYIASVSVEDDLIPEDPQRTRGTLSTYGWALAPVKIDGNYVGVQATFIAHMHMGGTTPLPSAIVRALTTQAYADRIHTYLNTHGCPPYIRRVAGKIVYEDFNRESKQYKIRFIAKHAPSPRRQSSSQKIIGSMWCTDVRIHQSVYPMGYSVTTHTRDVRVDVRPLVGLRIYTERNELDGQTIELVIQQSQRSPGDGPRYTCNDKEIYIGSNHLKRPTPDDSIKPIDKGKPVTTAAAITTTSVQIAKRSDSVEQDASLVDQTSNSMPLRDDPETVPMEKAIRRDSHVLVINEDLSFTAQQFLFIVLLMAMCYYLGKFSCKTRC